MMVVVSTKVFHFVVVLQVNREVGVFVDNLSIDGRKYSCGWMFPAKLSSQGGP
jgi:hypothetical protein